MDTGGHFRCKEFLFLPLHEMLTTWGYKRVYVCLFEQGHGKSQCDQHFSHVGYWVRQRQLEKDVFSTGDVVDAIQAGYDLSNIE